MELEHTLEGHQLGVISVKSIPPTGDYVVSNSLDNHIRIWDLQQEALIRSIEAGPVESWTLTVSPDGRFVATGSHTGNVNIYSLDTAQKTGVLETSKGKFVMSVAFVSVVVVSYSIHACYNLLRVQITGIWLVEQRMEQ